PSGSVSIYAGNCVISGKSLTNSQILLSANTQITGAWNISSSQIIDLSPGTYWITGDLKLQPNAVLKCSACDNTRGLGVTLILTTQSRRFAGIVIVQDSHNLPPGTTYTSSYNTIGGVLDTTLNGLVYFPNSSVTFHGAPSAAGPQCLLLVVKTLNIDASSRLETGGCRTAGLGNLPVIYTVAISE